MKFLRRLVKCQPIRKRYWPINHVEFLNKTKITLTITISAKNVSMWKDRRRGVQIKWMKDITWTFDGHVLHKLLGNDCFVWRASHTLFVQTKIIWTCCHRGEDRKVKPIRNKKCPCQPCFLLDQEKMTNSCRGPQNYHYCQVWFQLV